MSTVHSVTGRRVGTPGEEEVQSVTGRRGSPGEEEVQSVTGRRGNPKGGRGMGPYSTQREVQSVSCKVRCKVRGKVRCKVRSMDMFRWSTALVNNVCAAVSEYKRHGYCLDVGGER